MICINSLNDKKLPLSWGLFFFSELYLTKTGVDWWLPDNLVDKDSFILVGSIHNFSYLGGFFGLIIGIIYLVRQNRIQRATSAGTA